MAVTIVQQSCGNGNQALANPITAGNTLVIAVGIRNNSLSSTPSGFTLSAEGIDVNPGSGGGGATDTISLYTKVAVGGEPQNTTGYTGLFSINMVVGYYELSAGSTITDHDAFGSAPHISTFTAPDVTVTTGDLVLYIGQVELGDATGAPTWTPGSGMTQDADSKAFDGHPFVTIAHHAVVADGTFSASATNSGSGPGNCQVFVFNAVTPAAPGMWFDFNRDGFDDGTSTSSTDHPLARALPEGSASGISDNVTSDVISVQIDRTLTGPGTMTVTTKNGSGKYNPDNSASSVYGLIQPGMPAWFGVNSDGTVSGTSGSVYGRFGGYLRTVAPIAVSGATDPPTAEWVFDDPFARYAQTKARVAFSTSRTIATYREAILTAIGETRTDLTTEADTLPMSGTLGVSTQTVTGHRLALRLLAANGLRQQDISTALDAELKKARKPPVTYALSLLEELNSVVGTSHYIAPADTKEDWYTYTTINRDERLDDAAVAALSGASVADTSGYINSVDGVENAMAVEARPFRVAAQAMTVWQHPTVPFSIDPANPRFIAADFGDIVFDASLAITSSGSATTATVAYYGSGAVIQLTSSGVDTVTDITITGRPVERLDPILVERNSTSSQTAYGERQGASISSDLLTSEGLAEGIAAYHLWANAQPRKTPAVTIYNQFATLLPLDLLDIVTLTVTELDVSAKRFEITGIHETWTHAASASLVLAAFTIDLRETTNDSALSFLTFGTSTYGGSDIFAP